MANFKSVAYKHNRCWSKYNIQNFAVWLKLTQWWLPCVHMVQGSLQLGLFTY